MTRALGWITVALLLGSNVWEIVRRAPSHALLPIFVPASLEHEATMRTDRQQPAGRGGEEAVALADWLLTVARMPDHAEALRPHVETLKADRSALLAVREERHALNIRLMQAGVTIGKELTAQQWSVIVDQRDSRRARADAELFDRVLDQLR